MTLSATLLIVAQIAVVGAVPVGDTTQAPSVRSPSTVTAPANRSPVAFDASRFDSLTANALRGLFDDASNWGSRSDHSSIAPSKAPPGASRVSASSGWCASMPRRFIRPSVPWESGATRTNSKRPRSRSGPGSMSGPWN